MIPSFFAVLLFAAAPAVQAASPLTGVWLRDGSPYAELRPDGTAVVDGHEGTWQGGAKTLTLAYAGGRVDRMTYELKGKALTVVFEGKIYSYTRGPSRRAASKGAAGNDRLSKLLLSSAWCSFRYNKITGTSRQERAVFHSDGTWDSGARGETYSSGSAGTAYGQTDSSSGGLWKVSGRTLLMSSGRGPLEDTGLIVSRNSNGYPILATGDKEYSSCR